LTASNGNVSIYANANTTAALVIANSGINVPGYANVVGNANVNNLGTAQVLASANITTPQFISNVANGTAPLSVQSTTRVANLNVDQSNIANYANVVTNNSGTWYPTFINGSTTANYQLASNANLSFNAATGALSATLFSGNGSSLTALAGANVTGIVPNANVATYGAVTTQSSGIYYPIFVNANTTGNYAHASNTTISANIANGALIATTFVGNILGNIGGILANGTSNVSIPTVNSNINLTAAGNTTMTVTGTGANITGTANISGNANVGNIGGTGAVFTTLGGTLTTAAQPNITSVGTLTSLGVNGTVTAVAFTANTGVFTGNGNGLSSLVGANVTGTVANATYALSAGSATTAGTVTTNAQPNITSVGTLTSLAVTGNITNGNITGGNLVSANYFTGTLTTAAQPNITSVGNLTGLTLSNAAIISVGSNTNVGTFTGNFSLSAGSRLNATYADLAEYYEADNEYEPGTVLEFGGHKEVTLAESLTPRVAGVVSTNPAYVMNSTCEGEHIVAIALQGRVPCKVRGPIRKGDMLVSAGGGFARPSTIPLMGTVIGKSLENFEGEGIIEVAVGRL